MEQQFPEFLEKRTTSRGIPKFSKNFVSEFPFHLICSWNFRLKVSFGNVRILPKTSPGSLYRAICPNLESSGIFGWMKSARCFLKNLSYYVLKNNWQYLTCSYLVNYLQHENPQQWTEQFQLKDFLATGSGFWNWRLYGAECVSECPKTDNRNKILHIFSH